MCALNREAVLQLEQCTVDVSRWARELQPGARLDAKLPILDQWAPATMLERAPPPFQRWIRVAFHGLPFALYVPHPSALEACRRCAHGVRCLMRRWRWVVWEGDAGSLRWEPDEMAPRDWMVSAVQTRGTAEAELSKWRSDLQVGDFVNATVRWRVWLRQSLIATPPSHVLCVH